MPRVSCSSAAAAASKPRLRSRFNFAAARVLSSRFRCGKAVVAAAAYSSSRLCSASSSITQMVCSSSWWQLLLWCLDSSYSSSLFSRLFLVVSWGFCCISAFVAFENELCETPGRPWQCGNIVPASSSFWCLLLCPFACPGLWVVCFCDRILELWVLVRVSFFLFPFPVLVEPSVFEILWLSPFLMLKIADDRFYL